MAVAKKTRPRATGAPTRSRAVRAPAAQAPVPVKNPRIVALARDLRSWTDFVLGIANTAADLSFRVATARLKSPAQRSRVAKAGGVFRDLRQAAGLTLQDLAQAINLKDLSLLEDVEGGKVGLPFEVILRLAGVLGRNDPIPVALKLTRTYNPNLWTTLEGLGVGRLAVQAGREREFANLYRGNDLARQLSDAEFSAVLKFVQAAFEVALAFRGAPGGGAARTDPEPDTEVKRDASR
jgi:transcriptional regulator with XRE-family HTH domain